MIQNIKEFKELECPFCGYKETTAITSEIVDEETGATAGTSIDSWDCPSCGESTSLVFLENEFKEHKIYADKEDWSGLRQFCDDEGDQFALQWLSESYIHNKDLQRALMTAKTIIELDETDFYARNLIEKIERRDKKKKVDVTFDQITDAFDLCDQDPQYLLDIDREEIARLTDNDPEDLKETIETNPERFVAIPPKNTDDEYSLMESFIHEVGEHNGFTTIASRLEIAINQKKPFRNFKDAIIEFPIIRLL